jgi:acyl-CoA synthetase (AMP-forming)/AMP-acid ligase II
MAGLELEHDCRSKFAQFTRSWLASREDPARHDAVEHADSVGYAVPSVDLAIASKNDDPALGELVVRGANVTSGYWQRPETTTETIIDGWLHTGDVARVDPSGRVHIVDQTKDIIIRGGENISIIEVEGARADAPGVLEAAVLAVPDEVMGEKVGAVVYGGNEAVDVDRVLAHCQGGRPTSRCPSTSASPARRCRAMQATSWSRRACARWLSGSTVLMSDQGNRSRPAPAGPGTGGGDPLADKGVGAGSRRSWPPLPSGRTRWRA